MGETPRDAKDLLREAQGVEARKHEKKVLKIGDAEKLSELRRNERVLMDALKVTVVKKKMAPSEVSADALDASFEVAGKLMQNSKVADKVHGDAIVEDEWRKHPLSKEHARAQVVHEAGDFQPSDIGGASKMVPISDKRYNNVVRKDKGDIEKINKALKGTRES